MEGKVPFQGTLVTDPTTSIGRKSKTPEGGASHEGCRDEHRLAKRRSEHRPTAPPGGTPGQMSGGASGSQVGLGEAVRQGHGG